MNILISGGSGFIGSFLTHSLLQQNHSVSILSRDPSNYRLNPNVQYLDWEIPSLQSAVDQADVIINLAGKGLFENRWNEPVKQSLINSRLNATQQLVNAINQSQSPPSLFLSGSAIGIYGDTGSTEVDESHQTNTLDFAASLCQQWENEANKINTQHTRLCIARTGIVLHPSGGALANLLPAFKWGGGGYLGSGGQYFPWIHIQDAVNALIHAIHQPSLAGPYNLCAPNSVTNKHFSLTLAQTLNRPCWFRTPSFMLKLMLGEVSETLTHSARIKPSVLHHSGFQWQHPELMPALQQLLSPK